MASNSGSRQARTPPVAMAAEAALAAARRPTSRARVSEPSWSLRPAAPPRPPSPRGGLARRVAHQRGQARQRRVVERLQPVGVRRLREEQSEQVGRVGAVGGARQQAPAQALAELAEQVDARREAEVGEQRGDVGLVPDARQQRRDAPPRLLVALEHVEGVAQPEHRQRPLRGVGRRRGGDAARLGRDGRRRIGGRRGQAGCRRFAARRRVAQPLDEADQPEMALGGARLRVGGAQQRGQVPGARRRAPAEQAAQAAGPPHLRQAQCSAEASVSPNSPTGASKGRASSVMQK